MASEMARRVQRICRQVLGDNAAILTDALAWAGTFHGIGARLLRMYAEQIGLSVDFTIHDREDSADLMNLVRHELGISAKQTRFPTKTMDIPAKPPPPNLFRQQRSPVDARLQP